MKIAEAEEEEKRRKEIASAKQVRMYMQANSPIRHHTPVGQQRHCSFIVLPWDVTFLSFRPKSSSCRAPWTISLAIDQSRTDKLHSGSYCNAAHSYVCAAAWSQFAASCSARRDEKQREAFSRQYESIRDSKLSDLQQRLETRRKGALAV